MLLACSALAVLCATARAVDGPSCELATAGGGPGGLYTAWRLAADAGVMKGESICVFERAQRFGGRTFSLYNQGPKKDLTVDIGAYRFCGSPNATDCDGCEMCKRLFPPFSRVALHSVRTAPFYFLVSHI